MVNDHEQGIEPLREQGDETSELDIPTGGPEDFGFPANPTMQQTQCWKNQERVLDAIQGTGTMHSAAIAAGLTVWAVDRWVTTDLYSFKKRREMALQVYDDMLDAEIDRRAVEGVDKPVIHKGEITGTYKEYSDNLLMFRRKQRDPSYRDNYTTEITTNKTDVRITKITVRSVHDLPMVDQVPEVRELPAPEPVTDAEYRELPEGDEEVKDE